jgi:hypothetical protein
MITRNKETSSRPPTLSSANYMDIDTNDPSRKNKAYSGVE